MTELISALLDRLLIAVLQFSNYAVTDLYAEVDGGGEVEGVSYSGIDTLQYYLYLVTNYFAEYAWQVRLCYLIVLGCILTMIVVFSLFMRSVVRRKNYLKKQQKLYDRFYRPFQIILGSDTMRASEIEEILGCEEVDLRRMDPSLFADLLTRVRMEMYEIVYLPNFQRLADMTGVRNLYEENLLKNRNVFQTLQTLCMFQLIISEGRLANYVNTPSDDIRMMARMCYILCSVNEPYRYLLKDLDAAQSMMRPMILHYIFGWMKSQDRHMPNFLATSARITNPTMAAFMIREVAYWGSDEEKDQIPKYYLAERRDCRAAAISVTGQLGREDFEQQLIDSYVYQTEHLRRDVMRAVLAIKSGKRVQFFIDAYKETPSRDTRELCLNCLYSYSDEGRRAFERIRANANDEERIMMEQIDTSNLLVQIRAYS